MKVFIPLLALLGVSTMSNAQDCSNLDNNIGVTSRSLRWAILKEHNKFRRRVARGRERRGADGKAQPGAKNMKVLRWDPQLAARAQEHADVMAAQDQFFHDSNEARKACFSFFSVGQNLGAKSPVSGSAADFYKDRIAAWYNEVNDFNEDLQVDSFVDGKSLSNGKPVGHYTAVVWADTEFVGCAEASSAEWRYFVCNYGRGGNIIGRPIYERAANAGEVGSNCPAGYIHRRGRANGLCYNEAAWNGRNFYGTL